MSSFHQWAGPVEDLGEEFDKIDENGGGQVIIQMMIMINKILTIIVIMKIIKTAPSSDSIAAQYL